MSLAYISFTDVQNNMAQFYADGGVNIFYRYVIGSNKAVNNGLEEIEEVTHSSAVFENRNQNGFNSRFLLQIPANLFPANSKYLQLITYKDAQGNSPNQSNVVRVNIGANILNDEWPLVQQQNKTTKMYSENRQSLAFNNSRNIGFAFQEPPVSKALFWDTILDAARILVPIASNLLGTNAPAPTGGATTGAAATIPSLQTVMPILQAIMNVIRSGPAPVASPTVSTAASFRNGKTRPGQYAKHPLHKKYHKLLAKSTNYSKAKFIDGGLITGPMLAAIAGPILQILPSLMNGQNQAKNQRELQEQNYLANLLAQSNQADILRLMALNGGLNQPPAAVSPALPVPAPVPTATAPAPAGVATAESLSANKLAPKIAISIDKQNAITVNGNPKYVYGVENKISLSVHVNTNLPPPAKPISKAIATLSIKKAEGLKEVLVKKFYLKEVFLNSMLLLDIYKEELQNLPLQEDLIVDIQFKWLNKEQKSFSAPKQTFIIFLVNSYFMKERIGKVGDVLALNDLDKYKVFWNKIWESSTTDRKKWEGTFSVKYYTYYNIKATSNGKIETKLLLNDDRGGSDKRNYYNGKLKSGLEISPTELNKLIPKVSAYQMLDEQKLKPFISKIMEGNFNKQAMVNVEMKGNKEEIGSLWTYPEINMAKYILYKPSKTNENGQVTNIEEEEVFFPELNTIHFLGLKTNHIN